MDSGGQAMQERVVVRLPPGAGPEKVRIVIESCSLPDLFQFRLHIQVLTGTRARLR